MQRVSHINMLYVDKKVASPGTSAAEKMVQKLNIQHMERLGHLFRNAHAISSPEGAACEDRVCIHLWMNWLT